MKSGLSAQCVCVVTCILDFMKIIIDFKVLIFSCFCFLWKINLSAQFNCAGARASLQCQDEIINSSLNPEIKQWM